MGAGLWVKNYARTAPVTAGIVVACCLAWIVTAVQARSLSGSYYDSSLAFEWTLWGPQVLQGEYLRPLGAMFMHLDLGHLAVNMFLLVFIGREIERAYGSALYACAYLAGGLGAAASVLFMDFSTPTVGASGALYALMVLLIGVYRSRGMDLRAPIVLVLANMVYTVMSPGVSLWGHVGGVVAGLLMLPFIMSRRTQVRWIGTVSVLGVSLILMWFSTVYWG